MIADKDYLTDEDYLREAVGVTDEAGCEVDLCCNISRKYNIELTLEQATALMERIEDLCPYHFIELSTDDDGWCDQCREPG